MANETPNEAAPAVDYKERVARQQAVVDKLRQDIEKKPTAELKAELLRRNDTLLHLKNMAKGDQNERARAAAQTARSITLNHAVQQPV